MKVDVSMTTEEDKFYVNFWWVKTPEFAVASLAAQLKAAAVIWPELGALRICEPAAQSPQDEAEAKS